MKDQGAHELQEETKPEQKMEQTQKGISEPSVVKADVLDMFTFEAKKEPEKEKKEEGSDAGKDGEGKKKVEQEEETHEEEGPTGGTPGEEEGKTPSPELATLMQLVTAQAEQLKALNSKIDSLGKTPEPEKKEEKEPEFTLTISDEDFDKAFEDKGKFTDILKQVYNQAVENTKAFLAKQPKQQPDNAEATVASKVASFYTNNKDLEPHRTFVQFVSSEVVKEKPTLSIDEILKETETRVRTQLNLTKKKEGEEQKKPEEEEGRRRNPQFAHSRGGKVQQQEIPSLKKELLDLM